MSSPGPTELSILVSLDENESWHYRALEPVPVGVTVQEDGLIHIGKKYQVSVQGALVIFFRLEQDPAAAGFTTWFAGLGIGTEKSTLAEMHKVYVEVNGQSARSSTWLPGFPETGLMAYATGLELCILDVNPGDDRIYSYAFAAWMGGQRTWTQDPRILNKGTFPDRWWLHWLVRLWRRWLWRRK